jgi:transcriptional regulator with XRE-family HTH domain
MPSGFSAKLGFVLKYLSMSRSQLAAELKVDKSIVGRWMTGAVEPSAHNLARLTAFVAGHVDGFTALDWDRSVEKLGAQFGVNPLALSGNEGGPLARGLPLALLQHVVAATALRGQAYEGFFRSTRPYAGEPGLFIHDHGMIRRDANGLLRLWMGTGGVFVDGWILLLNDQLFCIGSQITSGSLVFGIFNGVPSVRADVIDGLTLSPILDIGRTPTATAIVFERIGDLSGDEAADDARFAELAALDPMAPKGSVPRELADHLVRNIGPDQLSSGGDWVLRSPAARAMSRGRTS